MGAVYGEERQTADRPYLDLTPFEWGKDHRHLVVRRMGGDRREALVIMLDSRTGVSSPIDNAVNDVKIYAWRHLGIRLGWVPPMIEFYRHPLFRGRFVVSCGTGRATLIRGEVADSFAGPTIHHMASADPSRWRTLEHDTIRNLCSQSTLGSSERVRELWITGRS